MRSAFRQVLSNDSCTTQGLTYSPLAEHPSKGFLEKQITEIPDPEFDRKLSVVRRAALRAITKILADNNIDAVMGPVDARVAGVALVAGNAAGSIPLRYADFNGRACGMNFITGADGQSKMLKLTSA